MNGVRLDTDRLVVRTLPPRFAERAARFHRENWHFHRPWEPARREEYFHAPTQRRILRAEARSESMLHLWLLARDGRTAPARSAPVVGSVTLSSIVRGFFQSCYLGYKMDERYIRRGLMREALAAVIEYAFTDLGLHRIEANVMPSNAPSRALVESLGFREEGLALRYLKIQNSWEDHLHLVMLEDEWRLRRHRAGKTGPEA